MKRIEFLKKGGFSLLSSSVLVACMKEDTSLIADDSFVGDDSSSNGTSAENCSLTNSETPSPFPTR